MNLFPSFIVDKRRFYSKNSTHLFLIVPNNSEENGKRISFSRNSVQLLLIGLCLGITLGIALVPLLEEDDCFYQSQDFINYYPTNSQKNIRFDNAVTEKAPNKMLRPRFYTTELGLRKKLVAGIIPSDYSQFQKLIAINKTTSDYVDSLLFFVMGDENAQAVKSLGITGVVTLRSSVRNETFDVNRVGLRAIKYFGEKFVDSYDYFYLGPDNFYTNGKLLMDSVKDISVSQDVFWGFKDDAGLCSLETGLVLSRYMVKRLSSRLDRCLLSALLRRNLKNCFQYALGSFECSENVENHKYIAAMSEDVKMFDKSIVIGPLSKPEEIYEIHLTLALQEATRLESKMEKLNEEIISQLPKLPEGHQTASWPPGLPTSHRPLSRFDVLNWNFFTLNKIYPENDHSTESELSDIDFQDISQVVNISINHLIPSPVHHLLKFKSGYRRFDETRGMEYILDFVNTQSGEPTRVECLRPLTNKVELVPMPFVTEDRRVTIVLPVSLSMLDETEEFLKSYVEPSSSSSSDPKSNSVLVIGIILKEISPEGTSTLQRFKKMIAAHNFNITAQSGEHVKVGHVIVNMRTLKTTSNPIFALFDMLASRVLSPSSLVLALDAFGELKDEFLNRVRMNTILGHQLFCPVPFVEFDPKISGISFNGKLEIHQSTGYFDKSAFNFISFYIQDYAEARKQLGGISLDSFGVQSLSKLFVAGSNLHLLRAPEPTLGLRFNANIYQNCSLESNSSCYSRSWGSKAELAKLILRSRSRHQS